ncbi:ion transporter [Sulfuriroseicoccus oceanibius]|uniref:Ion transporter n=1 Tax=Sulfuriroseicoccus oceanibius TaxID=2707525 RepID=A0A6B3LAA6_9BACT|nr:ion transporter [Sulfuriroseicoccus oceanibius]QQL45289.1 ion transporter [Sulfuriroseicoccus oceanibius]
MSEPTAPIDDPTQRKRKRRRADWRNRLYTVIFHSNTPAGKAFDVALLFCIIGSVGAVMLESTPQIDAVIHQQLRTLEWVFTIGFTIEYILRLISARNWKSYAFSFFGIVDLLSTIPTYLQFFLPGGQYLLVIRVLRLLRMFRVLKMARHLREADLFLTALKAGRPKIMVFLFTITALVMVIGTVMYLIEGPEHGFTSIPRSVYWAVVTITTVGYGDISPETWFGQFVASIAMITGWAVLAVPTGIIGVEVARRSGIGGAPPEETGTAGFSSAGILDASAPDCPRCGFHGVMIDHRYCARCGKKLPEPHVDDGAPQ